MQSCFFIGHRNAGEQLLPQIAAAVERLIVESQVTQFYVGGYGRFDSMAGKAVIQMKERYDGIMLYRLLAYHPAERPVKTPKGYDGTFYPPDMERVPRRFAIVQANRYMVKTCDYLIAYAWHPASGALDLLEYARRREQKGLIHVENLAENI